MKHLLIIRHAKTEQIGFDHDFERELTNRGIDDCKLMSARLKKIEFQPQLIKYSAAKRTKQTAKLIAKHMDWKKDIMLSCESLYLASSAKILNEINKTDNNIESLAIVGHNPGITEFFNSIGNASTDNLPTCGMGLFNFETEDWEDLTFKSGKLEWYNWPKKSERWIL